MRLLECLHSDCTTWLEMSGNGAETGMTLSFIQDHKRANGMRSIGQKLAYDLSVVEAGLDRLNFAVVPTVEVVHRLPEGVVWASAASVMWAKRLSP